MLAEDFREALCLLRDDDRPVAALHAPTCILGGRGKSTGVRVRSKERQPERARLLPGRPAREVGARAAPLERAFDGCTGGVWERGGLAQLAAARQVGAPLPRELIEVVQSRRHVRRLVDDDAPVCAHVIEQCGLGSDGAVERRHRQFATLERAAFVLDQRTPRVVGGGRIRPPDVLGDGMELVAREEPLGGRADRDVVETLDGALRRGVERADRLDLGAHELEAQWMRRLDGPDIDEPTTARRLPRCLDERLDGVARVHQADRERLDPQALADIDATGPARDVDRTEGVLGGRGGGGDHEEGFTSGERREDRDAPRDCARVGVVAGIRDLPPRGVVGRASAGPRLHLLDRRLGVHLARHDEHEWAPRLAPEQRRHHRLRRVWHAQEDRVSRIQAGEHLGQGLHALEHGQEAAEVQTVLPRSAGALKTSTMRTRRRGRPRRWPSAQRPDAIVSARGAAAEAVATG